MSHPPPAPAPTALLDRLHVLTIRDRHQLRRRIERARGRRDPGARDAALREAEQAVEAAERRVERRRAAVPELRYPADLPITARREELLAALRDHQVVIVAGETGSGKSTQLPKLLLELGRGVAGTIGHTQPRRLAARTIAERVAEELGTELGGPVGYSVRFTDRVSGTTLVKVMTDGILLAEIQRDRLLTEYDALIVDEAHERSLNVDFILGYLARLLPQRPDLKVVVTSATIDTERFARHFGGAPVVEVSGRTHPVEVRYRPFGEEPDDERDQTQAICDAVVELCAEGPGDLLVFLSGEREIRDTADALRAADLPATEVLPLYARLPASEQHRVFQPHPGRRAVVLATNVAETSLTVPGIRYVVDPGTARVSRYSRRTKVQRLPIERISRASADQRAGRCGRVGPGICVRLYSEEDYDARPAFTEPEILRTNLASVVLQMTALGLGDVGAFPFVDPPDTRSVTDGLALLHELGALVPAGKGASQQLTPIGRRLARLPLDPRLGRMVLEGERNGCVDEVLVIAAALAIQDPRERPPGREQAAAELHGRFAVEGSDLLGYVRLWDHLQEQQEVRTSSQFRKLCKAELLNYLRVREWQDLHAQLREVLRALGVDAGGPARSNDPDRVHRSLLAGLLSHVGVREGQKREFAGARNARFAIAPGSVLFKKPPRWVMAAELVETSRLWARGAARIEPEWAERLGAHLVKRSHGEPWWDAARGTAMTHERVTLYGVPLVTARRVAYGTVDAAAARELFIRHALVEGDWHTHHAFFHDNRKRVEEVRALEDRARRRDILVGEDALVDFYDSRVPAHVTSARDFDAWWKDERARRPGLLDFTPELLLDPAAGAVSATAYPEAWRQGDLTLSLSYEFEPGAELDGVTVEIPLALLNRVRDEGFDWQVPGLREELVTALIRSLPKPVRRSFVPAPDHARAFLARATPADGPLLGVLARELARTTGDAVAPGDFRPAELPDHLRMTFRVHDEHGRALAHGKDLPALRRRLLERARATVAAALRPVEREGLATWDFGALPKVVEAERSGHVVRGYPALVDEGALVAVRVLASEAEQQRAMWAGTRRLLLLGLPSPARAVERALTVTAKFALSRTPQVERADLVAGCVNAALDGIVAASGGPAWDEGAFGELRDRVRAELADVAVALARTVGEILVVGDRIERRLERMTAPVLAPAVDDVRAQLRRLVHPGFVAGTGAARLPHVVRYLRAIERRLDKLPEDPVRDRDAMRRVRDLERRHEELAAIAPPGEVRRVRWMLEELRVSLFAQVLGTAEPVSEKRVLRELDRMAGRG